MLTGQPPLRETTDRLQRLSVSRFEEVVPAERLEPDLPTPVTMVLQKAMELAPTRRYQAPAEMLADLKAVSRQLAAPAAGEKTGSSGVSPGPEGTEGASRTVMIVESNPKMQDLFRDRLKKHGYRVLVISDPERALDRLGTHPCPADCVVFSAGHLGRGSLEAYNKLGKLNATKDLPALLLLGRGQRSWNKKAASGSHRMTATMPIKFREFREVLKKLLTPPAAPGDLDSVS
jgi:serine/threonine-protein kinase